MISLPFVSLSLEAVASATDPASSGEPSAVSRICRNNRFAASSVALITRLVDPGLANAVHIATTANRRDFPVCLAAQMALNGLGSLTTSAW